MLHLLVADVKCTAWKYGEHLSAKQSMSKSAQEEEMERGLVSYTGLPTVLL